VTGAGYCQAPIKRKKKEKTEQTQSSESKRQQEAEAKRKREAEARRQREAEVKRQQEAEAQRKKEAEIRRQQQEEQQRHNKQNMIKAGKGDNGVYKVGWYYNQNGKEGVVCEIDASGKHGKILNLRHSPNSLQWSTYNYSRHSDNLIGANSDYDGEYNTNIIKKQSDWRKRYEAANYCVNLGPGWYFPARFELLNVVKNKDVLNKTLKEYGGDEIYHYWSSTESADRSSVHPDVNDAMAYYVMTFDTKPEGHQFQFNSVTVRAISRF